MQGILFFSYPPLKIHEINNNYRLLICDRYCGTKIYTPRYEYDSDESHLGSECQYCDVVVFQPVYYEVSLDPREEKMH